MTDTPEEPRHKMARRLFKEFRPTTDMGDHIHLHDFEAETLAEIIAEYVEAVIAKKEESK